MPHRAPTPCNYPGCPRVSVERFCDEHRRAYERQRGRQRATAAQRGYDSAWRRMRERVLQEEPLCRACGGPASVVDHIVPIRLGGARLDRSNLQSLCRRCHARKSARERQAAAR